MDKKGVRALRDNLGVIWVFYEGQGLWGLKVNGKYETAKSVSINIPMVGVIRAGATPNCYLRGRGTVVRHGQAVYLMRRGSK